MFCTHCEFEIKGDDRKECPVCGGPLIDYSEVKTSSEEITSALETNRPEETRNEAKGTPPFDFGKALKADDDHPVQEPEEHIPLSSPVEPEPQYEATGEEQSAEDAKYTDLDTSRWETDRWQDTSNEGNETLPFDFGKALKADDDHPVQEPEEHIPLSSPVEPEPQYEATGEERSAEEVVTEIPDSCNNLPGQIIAAAQQAERKPPHASRKQLAMSVMAVLALVAAITTIAIFKPQQYFYQDMGHLKTKTERTVGKILSIITQREEKKVVTQKTPEQGTRVQQRQREHAAGNADPDKKRSPLEELSSEGKGKAGTAKQQSKDAHRKPLAQEETHHAGIASLKETAPPFVETDMPSFDMKPSTNNTLESKTVLATPVVKETSQTSLYSLHTGSFKNKEVAAGERDRLKKMGFHAYLQTVDLENGQTWHRIKVGSYGTREEAENTQKELRKKVPRLESYIMRRVTEPKKNSYEARR